MACPTAFPTRRPPVKRHHWIVRLTHWLNAVLLRGHDRERAPDLSGLRPLRPARRALPCPNPLGGEAAFPDWARLGGWLAGGLNWHFALAWPFVITGLVYLGFLACHGRMALAPVPPSRRRARGRRCSSTTSASGGSTRRRASTTRSRKAAYTAIVVLGAVSVLSGFAIYKPVQLAWLTALFGGYELARYWHFCRGVDLRRVHPAPCRAGASWSIPPRSGRMITGWYRGRFPSHD